MAKILLFEWFSHKFIFFQHKSQRHSNSIRQDQRPGGRDEVLEICFIYLFQRFEDALYCHLIVCRMFKTEFLIAGLLDLQQTMFSPVHWHSGQMKSRSEVIQLVSVLTLLLLEVLDSLLILEIWFLNRILLNWYKYWVLFHLILKFITRPWREFFIILKK